MGVFLMTKELKNHSYDARNYFDSQRFAFKGIITIIKNERNFRIQLVFSMLVGLAGIFFGFSYQDWISVSLLIALVLISEAFNSSVEALADTLSQEYRVNIKYAKDVSAGAVLISAGVSVVAGTLIVFPYVKEFVLELLEKL